MECQWNKFKYGRGLYCQNSDRLTPSKLQRNTCGSTDVGSFKKYPTAWVRYLEIYKLETGSEGVGVDV